MTGAGDTEFVCRLEGRTLLVVDDEPIIREMTAYALERMGVHVCTADSGGDALRILGRSDGEIDGLILDVMMPGMDGFELCRRIRKARPGMPAIFATAYEGRDLQKQVHSLSPGELLRKPYDLARLRRAVGRMFCHEWEVVAE